MMVSEALYVILIIVEIFVLGAVAITAIFLVYSWLKGAPYVPTENEELNELFQKAGLQEGKVFMELGCGDGRVVRRAVARYRVKGIGIDINPVLIITAKILSRIQNIKQVTFKREDVLKSDLSQADVIYIYLFPLLVQKLKTKLLNETKRPVTIIAHGFAIDYLKEFKVDEKKGVHFKTYYYHLEV